MTWKLSGVGSTSFHAVWFGGKSGHGLNLIMLAFVKNKLFAWKEKQRPIIKEDIVLLTSSDSLVLGLDPKRAIAADTARFKGPQPFLANFFLEL